MAMWTVGVAVAVWVAGRVVLGAHWTGVEVSPGVWQDGVSLRQWAVLWILLAAVGAAVAPRLPRWPYRVAALVPLLAWIGWSLSAGTLAPMALVIYGVPTVAAWGAGLLARDMFSRR